MKCGVRAIASVDSDTEAKVEVTKKNVRVGMREIVRPSLNQLYS